MNRFSEAFVPLGLCILLLLGCERSSLMALKSWTAALAGSLGMTMCFRRGASEEVDRQALRGHWTAAALLGGLASGLAGYFLRMPLLLPFFLTTLCLEWLWALSDGFNGALGTVITSAVILAGICLAESNIRSVMIHGAQVEALAGAWLAAAIALLAAWGIGGRPFGRPRGKALTHLPFALAEAALFCPWLVSRELLARVGDCLQGRYEGGMALGAALMAASRVTFRRSEEETPWLADPAIGFCAALAAVCPFLPEAFARMALFPALGCVWALALYARLSWNAVISAALMLAAALLPRLGGAHGAAWMAGIPVWGHLIPAGLSIAALTPDLGGFFRALRARRVRRRVLRQRGTRGGQGA